MCVGFITNKRFSFDLPPYLRDFLATCSRSVTQASLPGDNRALEPPDSIPNSEVKRRIADGSVGFPHVRVGHCQALILDPAASVLRDFFMGDEREKGLTVVPLFLYSQVKLSIQ